MRVSSVSSSYPYCATPSVKPCSCSINQSLILPTSPHVTLSVVDTSPGKTNSMVVGLTENFLRSVHVFIINFSLIYASTIVNPHKLLQCTQQASPQNRRNKSHSPLKTNTNATGPDPESKYQRDGHKQGSRAFWRSKPHDKFATNAAAG